MVVGQLFTRFFIRNTEGDNNLSFLIGSYI